MLIKDTIGGIVGSTEEPKIILRPVSNSGLINEPEDQPIPAKDYRANDVLVEEVPGHVVEDKNEKPMGGVITPLVPPTVIFSDGHGHLNYQGAETMQFNRNFDTYSCVIWAIAKALCYFLKERYNLDVTVSEMYNAFFAGVHQNQGTTIHNGMESFRLWGWTSDSNYPFTENTTLQQYQQRPPDIVIKDALGQLTKWKFNWEVLPNDHTSIINALQRTVVVATGFSWASYLGQEGVYYDYNYPANHCFIIVDYSDDKSLKVDDSYPLDNSFDTDSSKQEFLKTLAPIYHLASAHRVFLTPILPLPNNGSLINKISNMFIRIARSVKGAFFFIKDNKKASIDTWQKAFGAIVDEVGIDPKNNNLTDEKLNSIPDYPFFGK
jgi:hypothetical protein